ncbi:MAG: GNAT family N-acetyltransferase, partial [Bacteroidaceae bacterium]|nr:GNAT family N-acetyltransferase [Bacteroidaceae bacterium]
IKIELKQWALSDAKELTSLCNAVNRRFLSDRLPNPYTEKDAKEWLKMVTDNDTITGIYRAIVCDGKPIGSISVEKKDDDAEIGYMLHNDYSNKGIGTEAVKQICPIAFKVLSLEQITANVFQPNIASIRVLQKNDFKYKVTIPNAIIKDGNVYDLLIYGLTKETIKHVLSE